MLLLNWFHWGLLLTSLIVFITLFFVFRHFGRRMASILKRSGRYAVISMVPILLVVALVYGFMYLVGYRINLITATIAAISIGVGVDYATHFTMRFIEEFEHEPSRFPALRRTGDGTGGALTISAATSMTGFLVMATAPMPNTDWTPGTFFMCHSKRSMVVMTPCSVQASGWDSTIAVMTSTPIAKRLVMKSVSML